MPHRSPIIVALLFAATLAVNAVVAFWMATRDIEGQKGILFYAMAFSQLNVLAVWAVLNRWRIGWRWIAPFLGGLALAVVWVSASLVGPNYRPQEGSYVYLLLMLSGVFWLHTAAAIVVLWLLKPTRLFGFRRQDSKTIPWQFSIGQLLVLTTVGCLLLTNFVTNEQLRDGILNIVTIILINFALLAIIVFACTRPWHWLLRLASAAGSAMAIGFVCNTFSRDWPSDVNFVSYNLIQALITCAWLELGQVLPGNKDATANAAADPPPPPALFQPDR